MDANDNNTSKTQEKNLLSYFLAMATLCSQPIKEEEKFKLLNLRFNIRGNIL